MTTRILSGAYTTGYTLSATYDGLKIVHSGEIMGTPGTPGAYGRSEGGAGGAGGVGLIVDFAAPVKNTGMIIGGVGGIGGGTPYSFPGAGGAGGVGVVLANGARLANRGGSVTGGAGGEGGQPGADPHNSPGYNGAGAAGVELGDGSWLVNFAGTISGGAGGAAQFGGQGQGHKGAEGGAGVMAGAGSVRNAGLITGGTAGGGFSGVYAGGMGGTGGAGLVAEAAVTVVNTGTMTGGAGGGGGFTFDRYDLGAVGGAGGAGADLTGGGALTNTGLIVGGAGGAGGLVGNGGSQGASGQQGVGVILEGGAVLTNGGAGGTSAQIVGAVGVEAGPYGTATVVNFGTIEGSGGISVQLAASADRLVAEADSTFIGAVVGGGGTLELAKATGTITGLGGGTGAVTGAEALTFGGFGGLVLDRGGSWTVSGGLDGEIDNAGLIESAAAGATLQGAVKNDGVLEIDRPKATLTITGAVTGTGVAVIGGGSLDFTSTFSQNVNFTTASGVLELADSQGYSGTINGFSARGGTRLDLGDISFGQRTKATFAGNAAGGTLTVTDGTHIAEIKLKGDYLGASFSVSTDKDGGTLVSDAVAFAPSVHAFASAMAGMYAASKAGFATLASHGYERAQTMLAHPIA